VADAWARLMGRSSGGSEVMASSQPCRCVA